MSYVYLEIEEVARRLHCPVKSVYNLTRRNAIPFTKRPGLRRLLFRDDHLASWGDGAPLEVVALPGGGKLVRPKRGEVDANE